MRGPAPLLAALLLAAPCWGGAGALVVCDDVSDPHTLDPHRQFSAKNHTVVQQIYEGLVRFDPEGRIEPALAVSWERKDPLRMRFKLREGVRFHDGSPFDAEAVRFSIARYLDPATGFPALGFVDSIAKAEVVDPSTVDLVTRFPDGLLLNRLAGFILIVPPGYLREKGPQALHESPVGTGPFRFVSWEKGRAIELEANPAYWRDGHPRVARLSFRFLPVERQLEALLKGDVDIITDMPGTWTPKVAGSGVASVIKKESFYTYTGSMRIDEGPLADARVRRALNHAVNRAELIRYDALGNGRPLATLTMPGQTGHDPALKPYAFALKKSRALLREAGLEKGFKLKVFVKAQAERPYKILRKQLSAAGIDLQGTIVSDGEMIAVLQREKWDMTLGDCPDPMAHSFFIQAIVFGSGSPFSLVRSKDYDGRLAAMATTLDTAEQDRLGRELDRYIHDNALTLFTYQRLRTHGVRRGVSFAPWITGMPFFDGTRKDEERQARAPAPRGESRP